MQEEQKITDLEKYNQQLSIFNSQLEELSTKMENCNTSEEYEELDDKITSKLQQIESLTMKLEDIINLDL